MSSFLANESVTYNHLTVDLRKRLFNTDSDIPLLKEPDLTQQIMEIAVCVICTDSNITLSGEQTIQSVDVYVNNFVCVNGQDDKTENGVYLCKDSNWERWPDGRVGHLAKILKGTYANRIFHNINYELLYGETEIEFELLPFNISELLDVSLTSLITNDILKFDGTNWVNVPIPAGAENLSELNDVDLTSLETNDALVWDGSKWTNLEVDGLPSGTVNQTLRHDGTSFVANSVLQVLTDTVKSESKINFKNASTDSIYIWNGTQAKISMEYGTNVNIEGHNLNIRGHRPADSYGYLQLASRMGSTVGQRITIQGPITKAIQANPTFLLVGLTPSTLLQANASKEIVSIANASGFLKNDGSGGFSWDTPSGGVTQLSDLSDVELTSLATDDIIKYDGTNWINVPIPTGVENLSDLLDVTLSSLVTNDVLTWDGSKWTNATGTTGTDEKVKATTDDTTSDYLYNKFDVAGSNIHFDITNPSGNEKIKLTGFDGDYNSLSNLPTIPDELSELTDVTLSGLATDDVLVWNGTKWVNITAPTIPTDISELSDTTNLLFDGDYNSLSNLPSLFDGDYNSLANKPNIPANKGAASTNGLGAFQTIANLQSGTTTLADISGTSLTLKANTNYIFRCDLIMRWLKDGTLWNDDTEFEIQFTTTGDTQVLGTLFGNHYWYYSVGDLEVCTQLTLNSPKLYLLEGGSDFQDRMRDSHFGGYISGGAGGGTIKMQMRITTTGFNDDYMILKILG
ncbi:MAG: hypothetical protein WC967_16235, partial [Balneolaceae bacterium]